MRIGFACLWDSQAPSTWSGTPWHLRAALRRQADIADVGMEVPQRTRLALSAMHPRWRNGRLSTMWEQSRTGDAYCRIKIRGRARRLGCDAVLQIQDLTPLDVPYFVYQDMSFDALIKLVDAGQPIFRQLSRDELLRRRDRQHRVYERAAGVFAMSHWLARSLVEDSQLPATKVHVLHPGLHLDTRAGLAADQPPPVRPGPRRRLLFVGRTFHSKGGDLAVEALRILRRDVDPAITLTVAGPPSWPLPGQVPDGVDFRGAISRHEVAVLYDTHDLFVLPTRIEGFGLVFAEALARGLPCVGRDAFAMPEMIRPGVNGGLLTKDDPADLASLIATILTNDEIYSSCHAGSSEVASWFSWDRSAGEAINTIATTLGRTATTTSAPRRDL